MSIDDKQIISNMDNVLKIAKGVMKTPNHYKCVNVVVDNLPENQHCKDIAIAQQIQVMKPGSNKIPVVIRNLSCRTLKLKKGTKIAHVEASSIVSPMLSSQMSKNVFENSAGNAPKSNLLENKPKAKEGRGVKKFWRV